MSMASAERLLQLIDCLKSRHYWTGEELARELDSTPRNVRRDIRRLREAGYIIQSDHGPGGGYCLLRQERHMNLRFSEEEAHALALATLLSISSGLPASLQDNARSALTRIRGAMTEQLATTLAMVEDNVTVLEVNESQIPENHLQTILNSVADNKLIGFTYTKSDGSSSWRLVEPYGLAYTSSRWYTAIWDRGKTEGWKTMRIDRMSEVTQRDRFVPRELPKEGVRQFVEHSLSTAPYNHEAELIVQASLNEVRRLIPGDSGVCIPLGSQRTRVVLGSNHLRHIAAWATSMGFDFTVVRPDSLKRQLAQMADVAAAAAESPTT